MRISHVGRCALPHNTRESVPPQSRRGSALTEDPPPNEVIVTFLYHAQDDNGSRNRGTCELELEMSGVPLFTFALHKTFLIILLLFE